MKLFLLTLLIANTAFAAKTFTAKERHDKVALNTERVLKQDRRLVTAKVGEDINWSTAEVITLKNSDSLLESEFLVLERGVSKSGIPAVNVVRVTVDQFGQAVPQYFQSGDASPQCMDTIFSAQQSLSSINSSKKNETKK